MSTIPNNRDFAVLYVDDEEQAVKYFRKGLDKEYTVLTATRVAEALLILEQQPGKIGVVITDQRMPGASGVELLTQVRERWPAIVRILVTAFTDIDSAVAAVNAGNVFKYLTKPTDFPLLRQSLNDALSLFRETLHRDAMAATLRELEAQRQATQAAEADREKLQQQLVKSSREAGRAEVATGILHNVGNVLNSINVSAAVVNNTLQQSRVGNLCKGLAMLEEHAADLVSFLTSDERGRVLPGYLNKLAGVMAEERAVITREMESLVRNVEHIAHVVQMQQSYAKEVIVRQPLSPADLMEDALRVNLAAMQAAGVEVVRDFAPLPNLLLDKHGVLQILINLVSNAFNAVRDQAAPGKKIELKIEKGDANTDGSGGSGGPQSLLRFKVTDNGAGIAPENLTRIFSYGFTTRKEGHGFGLHSAANAAREMGGSLTASSEGPNRGASFTLELPMAEEGSALANGGESILAEAA